MGKNVLAARKCLCRMSVGLISHIAARPSVSANADVVGINSSRKLTRSIGKDSLTVRRAGGSGTKATGVNIESAIRTIVSEIASNKLSGIVVVAVRPKS